MYRQITRLEESAKPVLLARATEIVADERVANVTDLELIPAPLTGWRLVIYDIVMSNGAQTGTVLLEQGIGVRLMGRITLASGDNFIFNSTLGLRLNEATSLTMTTTTGAGPLAITVAYATVPSAD